MFTRLTMAQRIQAGLILALAFLLVLGSNRLDQKHFTTVQHTVNSVYKDRVVVQGYLYELNNMVHQRELRLAGMENGADLEADRQKAEELITSLGATYLTPEETVLFRELVREFENLHNWEADTVLPGNGERMGKRAEGLAILQGIHRKLDGLVQVQLKESEELTAISKKSLGMNKLLSKLEVAFMVLIGILILVLAFYPNKRPDNQPESEWMNFN